MRWIVVCLLVVACGNKPAARHATPEIPVTGTATFAGTWLTNDEVDWFYRLIVAPDGRFGLTIERGKMGSCEQGGSLTPGKGPSAFLLTLTKDSCAPDGSPLGGSLLVSIPSYTGDALTLMYLVGETQIRRSYTRDPKIPRPAQ
ncbi:hypothetical protein BH11MYX3_BH11MYX3_34700 [soil metagenome]